MGDIDYPYLMRHGKLESLKAEIDRLRLSDPQKALEIAQKGHAEFLQDGTPFELAETHHLIARALIQVGKAKDAIPHLTTTLNIARKENLLHTQLEAQVALVWPFFIIGNETDAFEIADKAKLTAQKIGLDAQRELARLHLNLGVIHRKKGEYDHALTNYAESRVILDSLNLPAEVARVDINRANVYQDMDRFDEADLLYRQAQSLFSETSGNEHLTAQLSSNLGMLAYRRGDYRTALREFDKSAQGTKEGSSLYAFTQWGRALAYHKLNLIPEMMRMAHSAESAYTTLDRPIETANMQHLQAMGHIALGQWQTAEKNLRLARETYAAQGIIRDLNKVDLNRINILINEGKSEEAKTESNNLLQTLSQEEFPELTARTLIYRATADLNSAEEDLALAKTLIDTYQLRFGHVPLLQAQASFAQKSGDQLTALNHLTKAIDLLSETQENLSLDEFSLSFTDNKRTLYQDAAAILTDLDRPADLLALLDKSYFAPLPAQKNQANSKHQSLREEHHWFASKLERSKLENKDQIRKKMAELEMQISAERRQAQLQSADPFSQKTTLSLPKLHPLLNNKTALLFYETRSDAYCLRLTQSSADIIHLGPLSRLHRILTGWKNHISDLNLIANSPEIALPIAKKICHAFHKFLIAPLKIKNQELVVILPPEWQEIPLSSAFDGTHFLVENHTITRLTSPRPLLEPPPIPINKNALIIGHSDDGTIPQSLVEAEAVSHTLAPHQQTTLLLETSASINRFRELAPTQSLIHLSTHAVYRPDNPLFSWLRLDDQRLTMDEVYQISLDNRPLVVMSACESGKGRARSSGLEGLGRAFLSAGASALVVTLWRVEEKTTASLITDFYTNLTQYPHLSIAQHLQTAQRKMTNTHHPFFWAGFITIQG